MSCQFTAAAGGKELARQENCLSSENGVAVLVNGRKEGRREGAISFLADTGINFNLWFSKFLVH